jgi:hypothetical protein
METVKLTDIVEVDEIFRQRQTQVSLGAKNKRGKEPKKRRSLWRLPKWRDHHQDEHRTGQDGQ